MSKSRPSERAQMVMRLIADARSVPVVEHLADEARNDLESRRITAEELERIECDAAGKIRDLES